ncbi:MAG: DUF342 domain-containing protein [Ruminococcaceae bacterium]|nr:DUF342 domain-containing protein [Oscillospiraceae bacterium]
MSDEIMNNTTEKAAAAAAGPKMEKPPVIDGRVDITFDNSGMLANMIMFPPQNGGRPITMELVAECLASKGIVAGIDEFDIRDMLDNQVYESFVCIARAIPPKNGANGYVDYKYEKTRVIQPKKDEFGVTNYRELDTILQIRRGDIIADIIPPTEGEPGLNIFGEPIPPEPGKPAKVTVGKNSVITADSLHIIAACDGHIKYGVGCFNVEDTVVVHSDLDLTVGNIDFFGDVHIKGNVMEGFSVKAGKNLKVDGSIYSSDITAGGSVTVAGGIISSTVNAEGNVTADFFHNSNITAKGAVSGKEFAFCEVFCYGELKAIGKNGTIVGGKITAMRDVTANVIGSEKYTQTLISIGDGSVTFARKKKAENELEQYQERLENAIRNLEYLKHRKSVQAGLLSDEQQKQMKLETQNKLFSTLKKKELSLLIEQLDEELKNKDNLSATCTRLYPGAKFCINFLTLEITQVYSKSRVTVVDDQIVVIPN